MAAHPLEPLKKFDPELFGRIVDQQKKTFSSSALSHKMKLLIALAVDASRGAEEGVTNLVKLARSKGAADEEIADVFTIVHHICGADAMYRVADAVRDIDPET